MRKIIYILSVVLYSLNCENIFAQINNTIDSTIGYYQSIDLNPETPCNCNLKTQRTFDLAKGLRPNDVLDYKLYAYSFTSSNSSNVSVIKLFKSFENDLNVYKISLVEGKSFMILATNDFDIVSFEMAAKSIFLELISIAPEDFLKIKNSTSYYEYVKAKQEFEMKQQQHLEPTKN